MIASRTEIRAGVELILKGLGVDPKDQNFKDTPARVLKAYEEWFSNDHTKYPTFEEKHDELILLRDHKEIAICPHHLLPVKLSCTVAYIPRTHVLGLSKLARIIRGCLQGPKLQETLTDEVADFLYHNIENCQGSACIIEGSHDCMQSRGVRTTGTIITSAMRGAFRENATARLELLALCKK